MLARVEAEEQAPPSWLELFGLGAARAIAVAPASADLETLHLPQDHPQWVRDALSVSNRAKELISRLKPVVVCVRTFWDHRVRTAFVGGAHVSVDTSGSYFIQ